MKKQSMEEQTPEGWGPRWVGPERWGAQNFALFFPFPATIFALFVSLWVSSRGILCCCFEAPGPSNVHVGVLGLSCEAPAAPTRWREREKKERILGGPAEGGPAEGGSSVQWSGQGGPGIRTNNNHNNHNHNNTNTARSGVDVKPRISVAPKGVGGERRGPKGGPLGVWSPLFRFGVWVWEGLGCRSECKSLGLVVGLFGFRKFDKNTKTQKLAKVGLAKVGQHSETPRLAKVGLAKVGLAKDWPKSVKKMAKVGLAKVGHDRFHGLAEQWIVQSSDPCRKKSGCSRKRRGRIRSIEQSGVRKQTSIGA